MLNNLRWYLVRKLVGKRFCMINVNIKNSNFTHFSGLQGYLADSSIHDSEIFFDAEVLVDQFLSSDKVENCNSLEK